MSDLTPEDVDDMATDVINDPDQFAAIFDEAQKSNAEDADKLVYLLRIQAASIADSSVNHSFNARQTSYHIKDMLKKALS